MELGQGDHGKRSAGGDAEGAHGFAAEVLADAARKGSQTVCEAGVGRATSTLELDLPALVVLRVFGLHQGECASVAELASPHAELMAGIAQGPRSVVGGVGRCALLFELVETTQDAVGGGFFLLFALDDFLAVSHVLGAVSGELVLSKLVRLLLDDASADEPSRDKVAECPASGSFW